jgi:DNA-binding MarR family transcriptional regulator
VSPAENAGNAENAGAAGRTANLLGALALVVADRTAAAITEATGQSGSGAAALSAMHQFLDRPTLDDLRRVLGLTPSGAVRLVDRLEDAGLVARSRGSDGRSRAVALTEPGRRAAEQIETVRATALTELLAGFSIAERHDLDGVLSRMLAAVVQVKDGGAWICRLCDLAACGRPEGHCPTANAAAVKYRP